MSAPALLQSLAIDDYEVSTAMLRTVQGLAGSPPPRQELYDHAQRHGSLDYTEFYEPRIIQVYDSCLASGDPAEVWATLDALKASMALGSDHTLKFQRAGLPYEEQVTARVATELVADIVYNQIYWIKWQVSFTCADPRIYSANLSIGTYEPIEGSPGGISFPLTFPLSFGADPDSALLQAENGGTFPTPPVWTVTGPAVNPQIVNETTGDTIVTTGLSLLTGETLTVDVAAREVLIGGTSRPDVIDAAQTTWGDLASGVNVIRLLGSGFDVSAGTTLAVAFRDARI